MIILLLVNTLPKTSIFQCWALLVKIEMASSRLASCPLQASLSITGKSLWLSQKGWKWKGLLFLSPQVG